MFNKLNHTSLGILVAAATLCLAACGPEAQSAGGDDLDGWDVSTLALGEDGDAQDDADPADEGRLGPRPDGDRAHPRIDLPHCRELADDELADAIRACGEGVRGCADGVDEGDREARRECFDAGRDCAFDLGVVALPKPPRHRGGDEMGRPHRPRGIDGDADADRLDRPDRQERPDRPEVEIPEDALCVIHPRPPGARGRRPAQGERGPRDRR